MKKNKYDYLRNFVQIINILSKQITNIDGMYSTCLMKKKNGGSRLISVPSDDLKEKQKIIATLFENALNLQDEQIRTYTLSDGKKYIFNFGDSSFGFEKKKNILQNAAQHKEHQYFFKTDISKFFDSFDIGMVRKTVNRALKLNSDFVSNAVESGIYSKTFVNTCKYTQRLFKKEGELFRKEKYITALLCYKGKLATGSPASPFVANLYMRPFDLKINIWLKNLEVKTGIHYTYTRYADDICISSNQPISKHIVNHVRSELKRFKLRMNEEKTVLQSNKAKNVITGINVTPEGNLTVGRKKKEEIKDMFYHFYVLEDGKYSVNQVTGNYNYLKQVEPEYAKKLWQKYSKMMENKLMK